MALTATMRRSAPRRLVRAAAALAPHGLVLAHRQRADRRRRARVRQLLAAAPERPAAPFDYEEAVRTLVGRGLAEDTVRTGSMPAPSLEFVRATLRSELPAGTPLHALHVGNFVGISLASLTAAALEQAESSLVVSVDPNIPHLGVDDPQGHTLALLAHFGLQRASTLICGYTLEKTPGSDGLEVAGYDALASWDAEARCEDVLPQLRRLGVRFDAALVDGSHIGDYARRELAVLAALLREGGLVFLDDVTESWQELEDLFHEAAADAAWPFERVAYDGRVGALRRRRPAGDSNPLLEG